MNIFFRAIFALAALALVAAAPVAPAQPAPKLPRVAYVWLFSEGPSGPYAESFRERMGQLGWIDGKNFVLEHRDAHGNPKELDAIMDALVQSKVDLIVAMCTPEGLAAKKFTSTIPIVMAATGDPVAAGLAQSLARPGGNITGISGLELELSAKRVGLLKEMVPKLTQATALWNPARPENRLEVKAMQDAGAQLGIKVQSSEVRSRDELATQLDAIGWDGTQAILNSGDTILASQRRAIVDRAAKLRLPAIYEDRIYVESGGLMSYGPSVRNMHRRAADYVDRILKGAKPSDLPFEQVSKFEMVVNQKTAKALGVTIPRAILLQADEVIK
jgi:putative tryptophan/tyrosine transport system substrate-binding protein